MTRPIRLSIHALGGQGGGVLADWIVALGEAQGWRVQATSVPGVAQRTGATVYYLELAPPAPDGRAPILALMPVPGDVDIVLASELMEAGRAIARGLVTPDRTTLIASSHRVFAIAEKSAMGDGIADPARVLHACQAAAKTLVLADLQRLAEAHGSVISAALFGALAGSGALPFARAAYEDAIRAGGVGVTASLACFDAAFTLAQRGTPEALPEPEPTAPTTSLGALRARVAALPPPARALAERGIERLADYQDAAYAGLYLDRLARVADTERQRASEDWPLTSAAARHLALWMSYEDVIRVADLKTRPARFARVAAEVRGKSGTLLSISEFMHPRFEEFCDLLPAALGRRLGRSARARRWVEKWLARDRVVHTTRLGGFLLLYGLARLRRYRTYSLRYAVEQARIEAWLAQALDAARTNPALGVEILRCQRLVKGYGDTHARGLANFAAVARTLPILMGREDAGPTLARLRDAALADDEGRALARALDEAGVSN